MNLIPRGHAGLLWSAIQCAWREAEEPFNGGLLKGAHRVATLAPLHVTPLGPRRMTTAGMPWAIRSLFRRKAKSRYHHCHAAAFGPQYSFSFELSYSPESERLMTQIIANH